MNAEKQQRMLKRIMNDMTLVCFSCLLFIIQILKELKRCVGFVQCEVIKLVQNSRLVGLYLTDYS